MCGIESVIPCGGGCRGLDVRLHHWSYIVPATDRPNSQRSHRYREEGVRGRGR